MIIDGVNLNFVPFNKTLNMPCVYFILGINSQLIKIGVTKNIFKRYKEIQLGNPDDLRVVAMIKCVDMTSAYLIENNLHKSFAYCRKNGEWFEGSEVYRFIKSDDYRKYVSRLEKGE